MQPPLMVLSSGLEFYIKKHEKFDLKYTNHFSHRPIVIYGNKCVSDSNVGWDNVGPTSGRQYWRWANVGPTYIAGWGICDAKTSRRKIWRDRRISGTMNFELA